jgi:hypothetical protein
MEERATCESFSALPTRETEAHRSFDVWEFGFYEPPLEKMEKNKLMLREAMEVPLNSENLLAFNTPSSDTKSPNGAGSARLRPTSP